MPTQKKIDQVAEIESKFNESSACWFVDARGLTVSEVQDLRRKIRDAGARMHVYKNNLAALAIKNVNLPEIPDVLAGPTAFIFTGDDVAAPAKVVKEFMKENDTLELKGGMMDGEVLSVEEVIAVASLPSREELMGQIAGMLAGVARGLAVTINGVPRGLAQVTKAAAETKAA